MSIPTKRTPSDDLETRVDPTPQRVKNYKIEASSPEIIDDKETPKDKKGREATYPPSK